MLIVVDKILRSSGNSFRHSERLRQLLILALAFGLSSCGSVGKKVEKENQVSPVAKKHEEGTVQAKDEMLLGDEAKYPADMPFPQYPESKVTMSINKPSQSGVSVNLESSDSPDKVVTYYKGWFAKNKWSVVHQSTTAGLASIAAEEHNRRVSIMSMPAASATEHTSIQITLSLGK